MAELRALAMDVEQRVRMPVESIQITTDSAMTELRHASVIREVHIDDKTTELRSASVT